MHTYTNPFHSPQYQGSKPVITTNAAPEEYKGHLIFKIHKAHFDVVQNGALVTQMAALAGHGARLIAASRKRTIKNNTTLRNPIAAGRQG